jgi:L-alanine-DL-glutamate epimerase-like enolase superfamily enzyme
MLMMNCQKYFNRKYTRREFIENAGLFAGLIAFDGTQASSIHNSENSTEKKSNRNRVQIKKVDLAFEREPLIRPFGFKGGFVSELWQTAARLGNRKDEYFVGLGTQSVLWSDAEVFASHSESEGNELMLAITKRALCIILNTSFVDPVWLIDTIFDEVFSYGKKITGNPNLRKTFILNALVALDNAAWLLYAHENDISTFDDLIPGTYQDALSYHQNRLAAIPLISYNVSMEEVSMAARQGYSVMKIKIGHPGTQGEMLEKDKQRIKSIHEAIGQIEEVQGVDRTIAYYFDANGRYETKETLLRLLDYLDNIGVFERIALLEEPFPEEYEEDVHDLEIRIAADESAHTDKDAEKRIEMGYRAIALKPIAKTLSMSLKIAKTAHKRGIPCFCADLTVNPILVDWNKNVAARLRPVPELGVGVLETNGHQNYKNWDKLLTYHPCAGASWMKVKNGSFYLDEDFYGKSGGIFLPSLHYRDLFKNK